MYTRSLPERLFAKKESQRAAIVCARARLPSCIGCLCARLSACAYTKFDETGAGIAKRPATIVFSECWTNTRIHARTLPNTRRIRKKSSNDRAARRPCLRRPSAAPGTPAPWPRSGPARGRGASLRRRPPPTDSRRGRCPAPAAGGRDLVVSSWNFMRYEPILFSGGEVQRLLSACALVPALG